MMILETERLVLREASASDAAFILDLLNQPSFIKYIGDRNVRSLDEAQSYIESRMLASYETFGYGMYAVELKTPQNEIPNPKSKIPNPIIGVCGFVKRDSLPDADIGFAFLPQFEKKGYAFESAAAVMKYGKDKLNLDKVLAITTQDNESSVRLLEKLGFRFERLVKLPHDANELNLFSYP